MNRSTASLLIALALGIFGIYRAVYIPGMLVGPPVPLLLIGFVLQAAFGLAAGVGTWRGAPWAPLAIVLLGASVAATALIEVLLGIVGYLRALLDAGAAILVSFLLARYVGQAGTSRTRTMADER